MEIKQMVGLAIIYLAISHLLQLPPFSEMRLKTAAEIDRILYYNTVYIKLYG